jgi:hypothetical protein
VASGQQLHHTFTEEGAFFHGVELAFSPDSRTLAVATGGVVHLLDAATAKEKRRLDLPERYLGASNVAFSPNGRLLALGLCDENRITIWNPLDGKLVRQLAWEKDHVRPELARYKDQFYVGSGTMALSFTADSRSLIAACQSMRVRVWEVASGGLRYQVDEYVHDMAVAPTGSLIAGIVRFKQVCLWDARTCVVPRKQTPLPHPDKAWPALAVADAAAAYDLMRNLMAAPREAVALLDKHLSPAADVSEATLNRLVADLDDESFDVREQASRRLSELDEIARDALGKAKSPSAEARRRIKDLLGALDGAADGNRLRLLRAVEVLESVNTSEARGVLKRLAEGEPKALLTREAKAALGRLD